MYLHIAADTIHDQDLDDLNNKEAFWPKKYFEIPETALNSGIKVYFFIPNTLKSNYFVPSIKSHNKALHLIF